MVTNLARSGLEMATPQKLTKYGGSVLGTVRKCEEVCSGNRRTCSGK